MESGKRSIARLASKAGLKKKEAGVKRTAKYKFTKEECQAVHDLYRSKNPLKKFAAWKDITCFFAPVFLAKCVEELTRQGWFEAQGFSLDFVELIVEKTAEMIAAESVTTMIEHKPPGRPLVNASRDLAIIACVVDHIENGFGIEAACKLTAQALLEGSIEGYQDSLTFRRVQQIFQGRDK